MSGCQQYWKITDEEPKVQFFQDDPCTKKYMALAPGNYPDLDKPNMGIGRNDVNSIVVPPNMRVRGFSHGNYNAGVNGRTATWEAGIHPDLNNPNRGIGRDDIDSMQIDRLMSWTEHKIRCCHNQGSPDMCGQFWKGSNTGACENVMKSYCATNLSSDPRCKLWCIDNPGKCDTIATQYCASRPTDPFCSCLKSPLKAPACFDKNCVSAPGYRTAAMAEITNRCPSVIECNQNVTIDKQSYNNIVSDLNMRQTCTQGESPQNQTPSTSTPNVNVDTKDYDIDIKPRPPPGTTPRQQADSFVGSAMFWVLIVVVMMAMLITVYVLMSDDDDDDMMQPQFVYVYGGPPQ